MSRANPFEDMEDFVPEAKQKPVEPAAIDQIARDSGFISRQAATPAPVGPARPLRRRYTTGRNQQMNVKATPETIARFYRLADEHSYYELDLPRMRKGKLGAVLFGLYAQPQDYPPALWLPRAI